MEKRRATSRDGRQCGATLPIALISRAAIAHWAPFPPAPDRRVTASWSTAFAKLARGLDAFPANSAGTWRARAASDGMGSRSWLRYLAGLAVLLGALGTAGQHTDGGRFSWSPRLPCICPTGFSSIKLQAVTAAGRAVSAPPGL